MESSQSWSVLLSYRGLVILLYTLIIFTPLHLWDERTRPDQRVKALIDAAFGEFAKIPEKAFFLIDPLIPTFSRREKEQNA